MKATLFFLLLAGITVGLTTQTHLRACVGACRPLADICFIRRWAQAGQVGIFKSQLLCVWPHLRSSLGRSLGRSAGQPKAATRADGATLFETDAQIDACSSWHGAICRVCKCLHTCTCS
ncbi:hypothetical protein GGTG_10746 [Gaeumannomyces tritici R3-111a-1]|uniref:Secreted protein n=1 Tax=Gaeumannomyces tritici (strain R3-111a-1) TaxID=644352 RepID=J3PB73_GAET3|nr:hypothetical protein GGTG_10746 [Gaeumannomyces tritici R3-111a-1]EJT71489.1 hypothetical protein GGTG_10746 [Gaeumannomyces tritici R3-111a-1]